ncbi:MAG: hypothetical protein JWR80_6004 [Bradyrhizobium sp.]|nr:hypothetical protein [Bradyrhizobium sp.]
MAPDFSSAQGSPIPFPHLRAADVIDPDLAERMLLWLKDEADWTLRVEDFYEQHEIGLLEAGLPEPIDALISPAFIDAVRTALEDALPHDAGLTLVDVSAHRLTAGQTIRIHNDHIGGEETHRFLIQLNDGWTVDMGGLLMLFAEDRPEALIELVLPVHRSGFGFEISARSHHAVSTVKDGSRYTLVYTFRQGG